MKHTAYLGLGTNLGDRLENLAQARRRLEPQVSILASSSIYETSPWGYPDQPDFLNQVLQVETELPPPDLLKFLKELETEIGRTPGPRYGPRVIDIDILFYDHLILSQAGLNIPHPRLEQRAFVLVPLAELAPDLRHPVLGRTVQELLAEIDHTDVVRVEPKN